MMKVYDLVAVATLCLPISANAATVQSHHYDPANQPKPGVAAPNLSNTGTGLGTALLAAHVGADGSLINGVGATGSQLISGFTGNYEVDFNRNVSNCTYTANAFSHGEIISLEPRSGTANGVFVHTTANASTTDTNEEFYLMVFCNQ